MPSVMPMSSTVWWASMSRSPLARTVKSTMPWRATWSSMWSRNGMPEASFDSPRPSSASATKICVSFVSRWISALRMGSAEDGAEGVDEAQVFFGSSDGEPEAVGEKRVRPVESADQYTTLPESLERGGPVGHAHEDEVRRRGKALDPGNRVER